MSTSDLLLVLLINLIITAVAYLLVPVILVVIGKQYEKKTIRKIAFINAFVVYILFMILHSASGDGNASLGAFVIWGSIGHFLLEKKCLAEEYDDMTGDDSACTQDHWNREKKQKVVKVSCSDFGMKWYNFFTKVRPWIVIAATVILLIGSGNTLLDINNIGATLLLFNWIYILASLISAALQMILFFKEKNQDPNLLSFIEITLVYDFLFSTYAYVILEYQAGLSFGVIAVVVLALVLFEYFVWYKCNMKYFEKRLCTMPATPRDGEKRTLIKATPLLHPQKRVSPSEKDAPILATSVTDKVANYVIINNSLAAGFLENARHKFKVQIKTETTEHRLVRKTDLMKIIFGNISQQFADAQGSRTDLVVSAYYQVAFDEMLAIFGDQNDLMQHYAVSKATDAIDNDIHKYLQMIVRIQFMIDDAIASSKNCDAFYGYSKHLQANIFNELNSYIDDTTDWNKL